MNENHENIFCFGRQLLTSQTWVDLHGCGGASGVAAYGETIATAGEDGKVNILNVRQRNPVKVSTY